MKDVSSISKHNGIEFSPAEVRSSLIKLFELLFALHFPVSIEIIIVTFLWPGLFFWSTNELCSI